MGEGGGCVKALCRINAVALYGRLMPRLAACLSVCYPASSVCLSLSLFLSFAMSVSLNPEVTVLG